MAEDGWKDAFRVGARKPVVIGVADADGLDFNEDVTEFRALQVHGLDGESVGRLPSDGGFRFHRSNRHSEGAYLAPVSGSVCRL
jgi:hypothetical protein